MGSSVSVMIAQYLSERVAERILSHLISSRAALSGEFSVFVDDIFISWEPICSDVDVDELIDWAVRTTASELNVTFKFCQIYIVGTSPMVNCLGDALAMTRPLTRTPEALRQLTGSRGSNSYRLSRIETIDVLGVVFHPGTGGICLKDDFKTKLSSSLKDLNYDTMTARDLWSCVGLCFYTIYAIGVCPSRFYGVFRCLSRLAKILQGASRHDPIWNGRVVLSSSEISSMSKLVNYVLQFPTNVFAVGALPNRYVFTDASNEGLGVVIFASGRVEVHSRLWSPFERLLSINVKESIAACQGIVWLSPLPMETVFLGVDNTVAFFEIISGQSANEVSNECVGIIRRRSALALAWIPTQLMPADGPSRQCLDPRIQWKVVTILGNVTRYVFLPALL